jgi:ribosomal protein S18 acetylase RimI-like enzyme
VIEALVKSAYEHYVPRIGRPPAPMLADYADLIERARVYAAEIEGTTQGVLVLIPQAESMLLDNIAVAPFLQGKGLGRRLLAFAEAEARARGYQSITLYTNEAMTENIAIYLRAGYVETHRSEDTGFRRVYMRKRLDS